MQPKCTTDIYAYNERSKTPGRLIRSRAFAFAIPSFTSQKSRNQMFHVACRWLQLLCLLR